MKNKLIPERPYEKADIDKFYWVTGGHDFNNLPLIKPFFLYSDSHIKEWSIDIKSIISKPEYVVLDSIKNEFIPVDSFNHIKNFNVVNNIIYGIQNDYEIMGSKIPILYFIINTHDKKFVYFLKFEEFKKELKKLNLPEKFLNPDNVYEQYKQDPILPWFPEEIKKKLAEVKK